jgi:hypothetical protein
MKQNPNCCIKIDLPFLISVGVSSHPLVFLLEHILNDSKNSWEVDLQQQNIKLFLLRTFPIS